MKTIFHNSFVALAMLALSTVNSQLATAHAQGTAFTYQGQLSDSGQPANGTNYGMVFYLYDAPTNGNLLGNLGIVSVTVSNGLFTVPLDFGNEFDGAARWLQISVQKGGSAFTQLIPRQQLTPMPYAIYAESAGNLPGLLVRSNTNGAPDLIGGSPVNFVSGGAVGATIAGGGAINYAGVTFSNSVTADFGTVSGGRGSQASGQFATVGGGRGNQASGFVSTIAGGDGNTASLDDTFIGGGWGNSAGNDDATVSGGDNNNASGYASVISGGEQNNAGEDHTTVAGGSGNSAGGSYGTVGGGQGNNAGGAGDVLAGGYNNSSGGGNNSTISGGNNNNSSGSDAVIGGGQQNSVGDFFTTIGGGVNNTATNISSVISGGTNNVSGGYASAVSGGSDNSALGNYSTVGGGWRNLANGDSATVGGGYGNYAVDSATVAGGRVNAASDFVTTVAGGLGNQSLVYGSTVGGGLNNIASGYMATIPGGASNIVSGSYSFAAGFNAQATNNDSFVWSDGSAVTGSTADGQFMVRASGGVVIYSSSGINAGVSLAAGSGTWSSLSDRNAKDNFKTITPRQMLDKVAELPITQWSYKTEPGAQHIGPMAQDFHAAFGLNGSDDRHIATVDEEGVALAAIQGLNQKLQDREAEIQTLKQQNDSLAERLNELAATVKSLSEKK
jgi:trimeric autotransporter adhesin